MIAYICIIALAIIVIFLGFTVSKQREKISLLSDSMALVDDIIGRLQETDRFHSKAIGTLDDVFDAHGERQDEFDERLTKLSRVVDLADSVYRESLSKMHGELTELRKKFEKVEGLIDAHTEMEKEAAKLEREWQEGLNNLLNYEVMK